MRFGVIWIVSVVAGFVGAISGMGGGVILIPALTLYGVNIKHAIALSVLSMLVISNTAASFYVKRHLPNIKVSSFLEVYAVIGAILGSLVTIATAQRLLFFVCGIIFLGFSAMLWKQRGDTVPQRTPQDQYSKDLEWRGSYYDEAERRTIAYEGHHAALAGPLVCGAAAISGLLGIGGSALIVLVNDLLVGLPKKVSLTTSNLVIGIIAVASTDVYLEAGLIKPCLLPPLLVGVMIGSVIGSKLITKMTNQRSRAIFIYLLALLGVELIVSGLRGIP